MPTAEACESCHSKTAFTAFSGTAMTHTGITSNCASCHETGMSWFGVTMVDRPTAAQDPNHPKTGDCSGCHGSTTSFSTGVTKPANHIPTTQACTLCHTNASNYAIYTMNHTGITSGCATCHGAGLSFANIVPKEPPANHIPVTGIACESCHAAANFTTFAGTAMNHAVVAAKACDSCHETGMSWYGVRIVDRPNGHHTGVDCKGCHNTSSFDGGGNGASPAAATKAVIGRVQAQTATSGSAAAIDAAAIAATPALRTPHFDHLQAAGACVSCHNGIQAIGKGPRHIQTDNNCDNCHTTIAWVPARFDHQSTALRTCRSCHNGIQASGQPAMHVVTSAQCNSCHSTIAWLPARFDHSLAIGACASCHNGVNASGKPVNHLVTTADCGTCHVSSTWYRKPAAPAPTKPGPKVIRPN
jgi:hypothetical protein